jgi:ABC-type glycerol-3-phosphate transport system substrate-binding protein
MKPFQAVVMVIFVGLALVAVFIFASFSGRNNTSVGTVVIWGSLPRDVVDNVLNAIQLSDHSLDKASYKAFPEAGLSDILVQAIASGHGPDLVLFPSDRIVTDANKIIPLSYNTISRRTFEDSFVQAGEDYLTPAGVLGLPFSIDPLIMYWNRTLYSEAGIARPPQYWDEFTTVAPALTQATAAGTLTQSGVALGEWDNITHAKDVLLSLIVGLGNPVITREDDGSFAATLVALGNAKVAPAEAALGFYVGFADPAKPTYSWSRSQPNDRDAFLAGTLATYFGAASEAQGLRAANPNLNFDAAAYPRQRAGPVARPARRYALSIPRGAKNPLGAARAALTLSGTAAEKALAGTTGLPSVRRDILAASPANPYDAIFRDAALNAFAFLDPDPAGSDAIVKRMVEDVSSGRFTSGQAVSVGDGALRALLKVR